MAKFEGEATPKSLTGRRAEDVPAPMGMYAALPAPATSSGLAYPALPPSTAGGTQLALADPRFYSEQVQPTPQASLPPSTKYATLPATMTPQLTMPVAAMPAIEGVATQDTATTLGSMREQVLTGPNDPPTPPQAVSMGELSGLYGQRALPAPGTVQTVQPALPYGQGGYSSAPPQAPMSVSLGAAQIKDQASSPKYATVPAKMPASQKSSSPPKTVQTVKDAPKKSSSPRKKDDQEVDEDKQQLIGDIRDRDAKIAQLLQEVRAKRARRMQEIDAAARRMDVLEARLMAGALDPLGDAPAHVEEAAQHPVRPPSDPPSPKQKPKDFMSELMELPSDLPPGSRIVGFEEKKDYKAPLDKKNKDFKMEARPGTGRVIDSNAPLTPSPYLPVGHLSSIGLMPNMYPTTRPPDQVLTDWHGRQSGAHAITWKDYLDLHEVGIFSRSYKTLDHKANVFQDMTYDGRTRAPPPRPRRDWTDSYAPVFRRIFPA